MKNIMIGTTFMDIKGFPEGVFLKNGRNAGDVRFVHGGVGRNIAEDLGRCGMEVIFVSAIGESPFTSDILHRLERQGVDIDFITDAEEGLGYWLAVFDSEGDVVSSISRRSDLRALIPVLERHGEEMCRGAANISVEIDMEPALVDKAFSLAEKYGLPVYAVISNMGYAIKYNAFSHDISCLVCNIQEAGMLFSVKLEALPVDRVLEEVTKGAGRFSIEKLVVTLGERGAVFYDKKETDPAKKSGWIPPAKVEVLDTTGAGDAFFSGVVVGLTKGKSLKEACMIGAKVASLTITTKENVCPENTKTQIEEMM